MQISPCTRAFLDVSDGDLNLRAKVGLDFNANERHSLYLAYTLAV
jgi:hypothetical protein